MNNNKGMSWGWIIFWLIMFWPVGLFFLFKKLNTDKSATLNSGKSLNTISYVLMGMGAIYLIMAFTQDSSMFAAAVVFGGGGYWLNVIARKTKAKGIKYKKYINLVINGNVKDIDNIAGAVGVTYDVAKKDLQDMINSGYFEGAHINESTREIVLHNVVPVSSRSEHKQTKVVTCKSCGANNTVVVGEPNECQYCGSPIE